MNYSDSTIVEFPCEQIFELVNDIESYSQFVRFCRSSRLDQLHDDGYTATLEFQVGSFSRAFTTRNIVTPTSQISMKLVAGPFNRLNGQWSFEKLSDTKCAVSLTIDYEFSSRRTAMVLNPFFKTLPKIMIESFHREAKRKFKCL